MIFVLQDLFGNFKEELIDACVFLCARVLQNFYFMLNSEFFALLERNFFIAMKIAFVSCDSESDVGRGVLSEIVEPFFGLVEALLTSYIVYTDCSCCISVINGGDTPILFLTGSVPYL